MPEPTEYVHAKEHSITRRNFFRMAVGSLVVLPTVAGGYLMDTAYAAESDGDYRQETDGGPVENPTTKIIIVEGYELGVNVVDTATGGRDPIAGARVHIVSRYNGKDVSGVTNEEGHVKLDIRDLAEDVNGVGVKNLNVYAFNGTVTVECPGYREFEMALTRITGGGGITVCTRNLSEGADDPYPRTVSFNEWDILYETSNAFITTPANDVDQTLSLEFRQMPAGAATVMLKDRATGEVLQSKTARADGSGTLKASITGKFLQEGAVDALPVDSRFEIEVVQGDRHTLCPIQLSVEKGVVDDSEGYSDYQVKPIDVTLTSLNAGMIKWPWDVPLLGGGDLKGFGPDFYVNAFIHPLGYFQLTLKTPSFGYVRDSGRTAVDKGQGWGIKPLKFANEWWNDGVKGMEEARKREVNGFNDWKDTWFGDKTAGLIRPIEGFGSIKLLGNLQLAAIAKWDGKNKTFQGMGSGQVFLCVSTCLAANFWFGPIPFLISFDFSLSTVVSLNAGFYTAPEKDATIKKLAFEPSKWKWDYSNTGLTITLNFIPSLSFGVGIRGLASGSVRGRFQATVVYGATKRGDLDPDIYDKNHVIAGWSAQISVVISMFFFTANFNLKNFPYTLWYDSWKEKKNNGLQSAAEEEGDWRRTAPDLTLSDIVNGMQIVSDSTLALTNEFNGRTNLTGQADGEEAETFDWETVRKPDRTVMLDDGTPITYAVYSLKGFNEMDEEDDQEEQVPLEGQSEEDDQTDAARTEDASDATASDGQEAVVSEADDSSTDDVNAAAAAVVLDAMAEEGTDSPGTENLALEVADEASGDVATEQPVDEQPVEQPVEQLPSEELPGDEQPDSDTEGVVSAQDVPEAQEAPEEADETKEEKKAVPRRRPSSIEYEPVSPGMTLYAMSDGESPLSATPKVLDVSKHGGIILHPDTDKIIFGNTSGNPEATRPVYGDPHIKVAAITTSIGGTYLRATCSFRIGVTNIGGKTRSRVIMTVIDAQSSDGTTDDAVKSYIGYSKPIDFDFMGLKDVKHEQLYDYDYDIAFTTIQTATGSIDMVHLVVVSGMRPKDDQTSIVEASTNLVFSYVNFRAAEAFGRTTYLVKSLSALTVLGHGNYDNRNYHCISNVRIGTDGTDESWNLLIGMLDRSSDSADAVLSDNYGDGTGNTVKTSVIFAMLDQLEDEWLVPTRKHIDDAMAISEIENGTILEMTISPKIQGAYTVTLTSTKDTYFFVVKLDEKNAVFKSIKMAPMLESSMRLVPWVQQDCFLTTYPDADYLEELNESGDWKYPDKWDRSKWMLQKAWWEEEQDTPGDTDSGTPVLHFEPIGPDSFNIDTFGINSNGSFIYWAQGREGDGGLIYNDDGSSEPVDEEETHLYQLMAARIYKGFFSDPFVVAEVDHDMSDLTIVASGSKSGTARYSVSPLEVLSVEHLQSGTDDSGNPLYLHHEANVWYTAVPHVVCATVVDCYAPVPFVSAGGTLTFHVTVRNDGNCYLKGCTLQLCLHDTVAGDDGKPVPTASATRVEGSVARLEIGEETLVESQFNPRNDKGELENVEVDFTLAPGKRSMYEVRIYIPKDWEAGDKFVSLVASVDKTTDVAEGGGLSAMADEDIVYQEFAVEPGEYRPYLERSAPDAEKNRTYMDILTVGANVKDNSLADAPLTHWRDSSDTEPSGGSSSGGNSGGKKGSSSNTKLPQTGDPLAGIATGLAAAGAALTAYGIYSSHSEEGQQE